MGDIMGTRTGAFLTQKELEELSKKKIGQGKEGKVYRIGNGLLFKIYYKIHPCERERIVHVCLKAYEEDEDNVKKVLDDSDIRIEIEKTIEVRPYDVDNDGVKKVYSIDQINEAMKKQKKVKNTSLPLCPIYIDNKLGGVVLKEHKWSYNIHLIAFIPLKWRLILLKKTLENLKELCDNYIYPQDFGNQDEVMYPHSNILVSIKGNIHFIDLEGKTTIYTEKENANFKRSSYKEFYYLFLDVIYDERLLRNSEYERDIEDMENNLLEKGFNSDFLTYLWDLDKNDINYDVCKKLLSDAIPRKRK
jgi:hypothetical protein